jgi:hypothetical protein
VVKKVFISPLKIKILDIKALKEIYFRAFRRYKK